MYMWISSVSICYIYIYIIHIYTLSNHLQVLDPVIPPPMIPVVDFLPLYQTSVHPQLPVPQDFTSSRQPKPPVPLRVPVPGHSHHLFPHLLPRPPIHLQPLLQGGRTNVLPPTHLDSPLPIHQWHALCHCDMRESTSQAKAWSRKAAASQHDQGILRGEGSNPQAPEQKRAKSTTEPPTCV